MTRIVITGADGQLGTAFGSLLTEASFLTRTEFDLSAPDSLRSVLDALEPDLLINCAAYTAVDRAEGEEELATMVNGTSVGVMAQYCHARNIRFVSYSTDYVFAGESDRPWLETDPTSPINAYGRSKLVGEQLALQTKALIIRTSWVVSGTHPNFIATMLRVAPTRQLSVVDDQRGCPTMASDLANATMAALDNGASGLLHLSNSGETTWFGFARQAVALAGIDHRQIQACRTSEYPTPAKRPAYSVLGSVHRDRFGLEALPHWRDSLPAIVDGLYTNGVVERGAR